MPKRISKRHNPTKKKSRFLTLKQQFPLQSGIFITSILIFGVFSIVSFFHFYSGKVYPGVSVMEVNLGGKSIKQGEQALREQLLSRFPSYIKLSYQDRSWIISTASIAAVPNYKKTAEQAVRFGRKGSIFGNLQAIMEARINGVGFPLEIDVNHSALYKTVSSIAAEIDFPVEEPAIQVTKTDNNGPAIEVTKGRNGRRLDVYDAVGQIKERLSQLSWKPILLRVEDEEIQITPEQLELAKKRAYNIFSKTLIITADNFSTSLSGEKLIPFINISNGFDREKIASYTAIIASQVNRPPQDALFQFEKGKVTVFQPSKDGLMLDEEKVTIKIIETISQLEATTSSKFTLSVQAKRTPPKVTTAEANSLGIKELLGQGISYFRGSAPERIHNIILLSSRLNGTLVAPGDNFSMAKAAGDISTATGYKQAYIIKNGRTVLGDGGGTCQPSTTLFRAALNSGLPIVERHPHAYRVSYYEQGGFRPGFDATIFLPQVDLKFKNDTPAHILIQSHVDKARSKLTFEIYGTKDGRNISISPGRVWDQTPPPPPLYQDDPTLAKGVVKQVDWAAWGIKAAFDYKITKGGKTIQERTFYSNFRPWQAVYLRGTKE